MGKGLGQLGVQPPPDVAELGDQAIHLGQLAAQHRDRVGTDVTGPGGPQAFDERLDVVHAEPDREQRPDLVDDLQLGVVVLPVTVGVPLRVDQALLLVVAQGPGARPGQFGQLTDQHDQTLGLDTGVNATIQPPRPPPKSGLKASLQDTELIMSALRRPVMSRTRIRKSPTLTRASTVRACWALRRTTARVPTPCESRNGTPAMSSTLRAGGSARVSLTMVDRMVTVSTSISPARWR